MTRSLRENESAPDAGENGDVLLLPFLSAPTEREREQRLIDLIEREAMPVLQRVLRGKFRAIGDSSGEDARDFEDVVSGAREDLVRQLQLLRDGQKAEPIVNFRAYCGAVAYTVWAEHLRRMYPARSMLLNRLRYLLENRTNQRGFGIWDGASGEHLCGFEKWRDGNLAPATARLQRLILEPVNTAQEALGRSDFESINLAAVVAGLFEWLGGAIELRHLVEVMGELLQVSDWKESLDADASEEMITLQDASQSPVEAMKWREYLRWLWQGIAQLSLPQRTAFLLHSDVTFEFEANGVASIRDIAALLEIPPEEMARRWNLIPLEDLVIAELLGKERQQVINLRRVARDRLGAAWKKWSQ
jgi:hypothetical protein